MMLALLLGEEQQLELRYRHQSPRWVEIPDLKPTVVQQRSEQEHHYCHQQPLGSKQELDRLLHLERSSEKL